MTTVLNSPQDILSRIYDYYQWLLSLSDSRVRGWLLVDSPSNIVFCILFYLLVIWTGPKFMQNRRPFKLTPVLIPYNFFIAALNLYVFLQVLTASMRLNYSYSCEVSRESYHPDELQIVKAVWWCCVSKLLELCDTFFFIFRKKDEQVTFLHVYHHVTIFLFSWIAVNWFPSGSVFVLILINSFLHIVMYTYYGLSALGPHVAKYLWWKKYLTIAQLMQFVIVMLFMLNVHVNGCKFPAWTTYVGVSYMVSFIILFGNFHRKAYFRRAYHMLSSFDIGCGQGNMYDDNDYSLTNSEKVGMKTE